MGLKEEVIEMKKEVKEVKEEHKKSFAYELLEDYKKANKRMFAIIIILIIMFSGLLGYTLWLLNDINSEETTITQENEDGYNNYVGNDGDILNGKTDNN